MVHILRKIKKCIDNIYNAMLFRYYGVKTGSNLQIKGRVLIQGRNRIHIGDNVRIKSGLQYNPIGGDSKTLLICGTNGEIKVGNNVGMSNCTLVSHQSIKIGNDVLLGGSVKIYDTDFHSIRIEFRSCGFEDVKAKPVEIKRGAFVGAHTIILKGVTIGENSVIGAGSVVTKSVPDGEIWAGNPARLIKKIDN